MPFTETLEALGSWEVELAAETPDEVLAQLGAYGHVVIVDGQVDVDATGNGLLAAARYVGVCRAWANPGSYTREGSGLLHWISDEDGKNHYIETTITLTNATLAQVVAALLPPTVTAGTVYAQADPATRYSGTHVFQSRADALAIALAPFGAELRVNGNFTVDVGTPAQLYDTTLPLTSKPSPMIVRRGAGSDLDLVAVGGQVATEGAVWDYSTRVLLLGQTIGVGDEPDTVFATGSVNAPSVPWKDPQGNPVKLTRAISESGQTTGSVAARAQLQLNRFNRPTTAVKVTAEDFEISGGFGVGDATYVYDPDAGIVDTANQVLFRGEPIHPQIIRVTSLTTPVVEGMTVAWRTDTGVWLDLTRWVVWEQAGKREITVGDMPKSLTRPSDPIQDRVDAARGKPSTKTPKAPTGLALSTSSAVNPKGTDAAVVTATWDPVTQYTDNTTVALSHYEVQYRPTYRAPLWLGATVTASTTVDLAVVAALGYDVQVRAISTGGVPSVWTSTASITSAADSTGPGTPSDPIVTQYLGLLRIYWDGLTSTAGAMPADFNRVDVHVGTTSGFTASPSTLVSSLSTAGYAHAQAPYGSTRFVRFIAYDHNGNPSAASATVSGATAQAGDGDIAALSVGKLTAGIMSADVTVSGRFATALTGARREVNAIGFQAFDASNALLVNLDGVNNLLTGIFKTALSGRRIEMGSAGATGEMNFYAPDGTRAYVRAYTETAGVEAAQFGIPIAGATDNLWNKVHINSDEWMQLRAKNVDLFYLATGGFFAVRQKADRGAGASVTRLQIDNGGTGFQVRDQAGTTRLAIAPTSTVLYDGGGQGRLQIAANGRTIFWDSSNNIRLDLTDSTQEAIDLQASNFGSANGGLLRILKGRDGGGYWVSTALQMRTPYNPGYYSGRIDYAVNFDGTNGGIEIRTGDDTAFMPVKASAFLVQSDFRSKTAVKDIDVDGLALLLATPVRKFRRKGAGRRIPGVPHDDDEPGSPDRAGEDGPVEIGLVAQEAPPQIRVTSPDGQLGVDLPQWVALLHQAVIQLTREVRKEAT